MGYSKLQFCSPTRARIASNMLAQYSIPNIKLGSAVVVLDGIEDANKIASVCKRVGGYYVTPTNWDINALTKSL